MSFPEYDWCQGCDDWIIWTKSNGRWVALDIEPLLAGYSVETFGTITRHKAHNCKPKKGRQPERRDHG